MNIAEIVTEALRHGVVLQPDDSGVLHVRAPRKPPEPIVEKLRAHKPEIIAYLREHGSAVDRPLAVCSRPITNGGRFARWNAADLARQAHRYGVRLLLDGSHLRIDASDAREIPNDLLDAITAKAVAVIRYLHRIESQDDLKRRFGPLSRHGRLCRVCRTIDLTRQTSNGEKCDDCLLANARATVAAATAQGINRR